MKDKTNLLLAWKIKRTSEATQCLTIKELIALMDCTHIHIEGRGNGSVILMGCV